ncbi:MAG: fatty acid desaturase [Phycisphaerae bacterium]|nr:MAG: fatty acid desaturase [Phycisphaerae bacterium]
MTIHPPLRELPQSDAHIKPTPYPWFEADDSKHERASPATIRVRIVNLFAVLVPMAALAVAIVLSWGTAFDWTQAAIFAGMSLFTALGVTVGFHRLFTHRSFETVAPVKAVLAILGSMAVQGPLLQWVGEHRRHHQHSDGESDPHSPHQHAGGSWGEGFMGTLRGFFHAHMGWLFAGHVRGTGRVIGDLRADAMLVAISRSFIWWVVLGLVLPAVLGGLITMSWKGALLGFLWGGLVRVLVNHHITWSVNSVCHLWGSSPFRSGDESRNNAVVGVLALGEGWHNNHHAFPTSARHGLHWWEVDLSYWVIKLLEVLGLAWKVRVPDPVRREAKRRRDEVMPEGSTGQ